MELKRHPRTDRLLAEIAPAKLYATNRLELSATSEPLIRHSTVTSERSFEPETYSPALPGEIAVGQTDVELHICEDVAPQ